MTYTRQLAREYGMSEQPSWCWTHPAQVEVAVSLHQETMAIREQLRLIVGTKKGDV